MTDSYIAAGYILVRPVPRPSWMPRELMPTSIISASTCLCPTFPGTYAIEWASSEEERSNGFDEIRLPPDLRGAALRWVTDEFDQSVGWPGIFLDVNHAILARHQFFPAEFEPLLIGLGLPAERADEFVAIATPPPSPPGYAPRGESGFLEVVRRRAPLEPGYRRLGIELLNVEGGQPGHSWLCNGLESRFAGSMGIRPNACGFIESLEDAERCCTALASGDIGAEPGPWVPWLLVQYT